MAFDFYECASEAADIAETPLRSGYDWRSVRRSAAMLLRDWSNRGWNLYSFLEGTITTVIGQTTYALPTTAVDVTDAVVRVNASTTSQFDYTITRVSYTDYINMPNKLTAGQPQQWHTERTVNPISLVLYPTPDAAYTIQYWYMKHMTEPTDGGGVPNIPDRFIPAFVHGLAYYIALKKNAAKAPVLQALYEDTLQRAFDEDRDRASFFMRPQVGYNA